MPVKTKTYYAAIKLMREHGKQYIVEITVTEHDYKRLLSWLRNNVDDKKYASYALRSGYNNEVICAVGFVDEQDAIEFALRF